MCRNANRRRRKNLLRLYGMEPVPEKMYDLIMRADEGSATPGERLILDQYVKEKMFEIRYRKESLGLEGGGTRRRPGRVSENYLLDLAGLIRENEEREEPDER